MTPTSAPGSKPLPGRRAAVRGFTLVELLVVLLLIALASGLAGLALRDGREDQLEREAQRLAALLELGCYNHPDVAAAILKPFVSEANLWMVQNHGIFQGYNFFHHIGLDRNMRDQFKEHPHYARTAEFVELYDNRAFDPALEAEPLATFEPMLRRLMAAPRNSIYKAAMQPAAQAH